MDPADYPFAQPSWSQLVLTESVARIVDTPAGEPIAKWVVRSNDEDTTVESLVGTQYAALIGLPRWPVIAYGSNANPDVLREKLAADWPTFVPMLRAELRGFDVVYSAHVSPKGAIPATLAESPDTHVTVFVLLLDVTQLTAMDKTEPNYDRMVLTKPRTLRLDYGASADAYVYVSRHGLLNVEGAPRRVEPIPAGYHRFSGITERQALDFVGNRLGAVPGGDPSEAAAQTRILKQDSLATDFRFAPSGSGLTVGGTTRAMRERAEHNHAIAISPQLKKELGLGRYAVLTCDVCDRCGGMQRLAVLGRVVTAEPGELGLCTVRADQSLRSAVGIPYEEGETAVYAVGLHSVKGRLRPGRRDRWLARWLGWRYLLMRVVPADVPDMEKALARIPDDAFRLLGSTTGDRLRVESIVSSDGNSYELVDQGIRAYALTEATVDRRSDSAKPFIGARHPDPEATLGVEPDILPIYLDAGDRSRLGVEPLDPVAVRPDLAHLLARELREFGLAFFLSAFAIHSIWESWLVLPIAVVFAVAVALMNIRARVGT